MKYIVIFSWVGYLCGLGIAQAQISPYPDQTAPRAAFRLIYEEALDLYNKELYGAANQKFEEFIEQEHTYGLRTGINNDLHTLAAFYRALSSYEIGQSDAILQLNKFVKDYPENTKADFARFYQGKYYFDREQYENALEALEQAYNAFILPKEMEDEALFMLGYSYFRRDRELEIDQMEDEENAIRYFNQLSYYDNPYQEDARYYKAVLLYRREEYGQAYAALKSLSNSRKYGQETRIYLANVLLKLKKYDELFELADQLIEDRRRNEDPQLYHLVANASYEQDDYENTVKYYNEYLQRRGDMERTDFFRMGYAYYKMDEYRASIDPLRKVLTQEDSLSQVSSYYLGFSYIKENEYDNAKYAFAKAIRKDEYGFPLTQDQVTLDAYYQYAKLAYATQDYEAARKALIDIEKYFPDAPYIDDARTLLGEVWLQNRNYEEAIKYFESIPRNTARAKTIYQTVLYYYGLAFFEKKQYDQAESYLSKSINNQADSDMALAARYWLGESAFRQEKFDNATKLYQQFIDQPGARNHSYYAATFYSLGWSNFKKRDYRQAFNYFDQFARMASPTTPKRILVDAYLRAGDCLFLLRNYDQANVYYNKVAGLGDAYQDNALYQVGESNYRKRNYTASVDAFDKLIKQYPQSPLRDNALDRISEIYITWLKQYKKGAAYADMLVKQYPRSPLAPDALARLAIAAYNSNNVDAAINYFKRILSEYGSDRQNAQVALDNLSNLLPSQEFDRILREYRQRNPELNENLAELTFNTAMDRFYSENYAAAINQYTDYIQNFKNGANYFEALLYRARSYKATNSLNQALADYEQIYNASIKNDFTNQALQEAAEIYFQQNDYEKSIDLYQMLASFAQALPNRVQANFGLAKNYQAVGNLEGALRALREIADNSEVELDSRTRAKVEIGEVLYKQSRLSEALAVLEEVEGQFNNEYAARSQLLIIQILFDQNKYELVKEEGKHMNNAYPGYNYLRAQAFLVVAEANYELGEIFQAKGVLESLISEATFPDVQEAARRRLNEIEAEEGSRQLQPQVDNNNDRP